MLERNSRTAHDLLLLILISLLSSIDYTALHTDKYHKKSTNKQINEARNLKEYVIRSFPLLLQLFFSNFSEKSVM